MHGSMTAVEEETAGPPRIGLQLFLIASVLTMPLQGAEPLKFTVVGIDCKECAPPILKALNGVSGARNAKLDWKTGEASVEADEGFDRERVRKALRDIGCEASSPERPARTWSLFRTRSDRRSTSPRRAAAKRSRSPRRSCPAR